jgi:hypothetical protein
MNFDSCLFQITDHVRSRVNDACPFASVSSAHKSPDPSLRGIDVDRGLEFLHRCIFSQAVLVRQREVIETLRHSPDVQNRQRVEPGVSSAVPTAVAVRGLTS